MSISACSSLTSNAVSDLDSACSASVVLKLPASWTNSKVSSRHALVISVNFSTHRVKQTISIWHLFLFFFFHLTYRRWTSSLPSCLWTQRIFPSLPGSRLTFFSSRCKFSTLTTRQPMVEFYLLTFPRFPLRKKEHKSYFGKNRTHDFRTSRCAAYLLDHSHITFPT